MVVFSLFFRAMAAFGFSTASRGDDARQLKMCAISKPIHVDCLGPSVCLIIPIIIDNSKTNSVSQSTVILILI
jgi:hypothetical protein